MDILVCLLLLTFQQDQSQTPKEKNPGGSYCNCTPIPGECC